MLSKEQVELLYKFCRQHYIHYYDVQLELVDHLATVIEEEQARDPKLSFESALDRAYKSFGGYKGMQRIQEQKRGEVERQNKKLKWKIFRSYFTWPRAIISATGSLASYMACVHLDSRILQVMLPLVVAGFFIYEMRTVWRHQHIRFQNKQQLLLFQSGDSLLFVGLWFLVFNKVLDILWISFSSPWGSAVYPPAMAAVYLPLYFIVVNCYREYLLRVNQKAVEMYPQLFAS